MRIKVPEKYRFEYVCCLPEEIEKMIMTAVKKTINKLFLTKEEKQESIENAFANKVCNLEDTIYIEYI